MRSPKLVLFLFLVLLLPETLLAQSVRWTPPGGQLGFNQVSELSLVFEECEPDGDPRIPSVAGLAFGRPSQSSQTSIVNFKMTRTFSFVFPVRPSTRSAITIPAFEIKTDKGPIRVPAATYTVGETPVGSSGLAIADIAAATLDTPKKTFWAGEVFPVTYSLNVLRRYYHSLATNIEWVPAPFAAEDWSKPEPAEMLIQGERRVVSQQTTRAYSKQPGTFMLNPASQMVNLMVGSSGFGFFAQPSVEQRQLDTKPVDLTIKPLPAAPQDFSGAVGEFAFVSKVVPVTAAIGEPITWTLELTGVGNWPDIAGLPQREVSNDFQVVQPKSKRTMKDGALFEGSLTEDVVLVPSRAGSYQLSPVRFTYFDTKSGSYKTVTSAPVTVTVTGGAPAATPAAGANAPVQFSLPPAAATPSARPELPTAVPPAPPENLPRDPITESARGFIPLAQTPLVIACAAAVVVVPLMVWLVLATLRSKQRDPQLRRREALARLHAAIAALRSAGTNTDALRAQLRLWQQQVATLWAIPHAAPAAPLLHTRISRENQTAATEWTTLWNESDRALHGRDATLPADWTARAESAARGVKVPGWAPMSLFASRNLFPFFFVLVVLSVLSAPSSAKAGPTPADSYSGGDFLGAESGWRTAATHSPADWALRHNLGLALAQQDRWAEAAGHWTSAFLLNSRSDTTRWELALGLQRAGIAPSPLIELSRGENQFQLVRLASPGEWQWVLIGASLVLAASVVVMLLKGFGRIGGWALPVSLLTSAVAVVLASAATFSLHTYGDLANPQAVFVWNATTLRTIPTDVDTTQKTSALSAGSVAVAEKTFLGWTKLTFAGGQSGWVRTEELVKLYR